MSERQHSPYSVRFGASWSTQFRLVQAIGSGLSELAALDATVVVRGPGNPDLLERDEADLVFSKSIVNEHRFAGSGFFSKDDAAPWLRSIAWLPQEDRFLFAVAPWTGIESFEDIAAKTPALNMAGRVASVAPLLKEYGFTYEDIEAWGGSVGPMRHTAREAKARYERGQLDACFGDGSAYDFTAWQWMASHGYHFLDVREDVMTRLEHHGFRRNITPAGFLPGIARNLLALDDSHIVLTCHERLDPDLVYLITKVVDERKRDIECSSIQVDYGEKGPLPLVEPTYWSSLTGPIERQWDQRILCAPLHPGAERYYRELGVL